MTVCSLLSTKLRLSHCPPLEITYVWRVRQRAQSRYCVTPVIQVTAHRLCLSCQTDVTAIETDDDRLLTGYKPSMIGYGKKNEFHNPTFARQNQNMKIQNLSHITA